MTEGRRWWGILCAACMACAAGPGCDDALPPSGVGDDACRVAVVMSDYVSSSVSLLTEDASPCAANVLHSGSAPPGVVTALSGDVVLPTAPDPSGALVLIDRYPNGTVTRLSPEGDRVLGQYSVATGFSANPQDFLVVAPGEAWVPRQETNPAPTADHGDFDEGGDVLIVSPSDGAIRGRIDLIAEADVEDGQRLDPRPGRLARVGDRVLVGLNHLTEAAGVGGRGLIVALDVARARVAERLVVPEAKNCGTGIAAAPAEGGVWVVCSGVFPEGEAAQVAASALVWIDVDGDGARIGWIGRADELGGRPLGFSVAPAGEGAAWVVMTGELGGATDRVVRIDRRREVAEPIPIDAGAFEIGDLFTAADGAVLVVANAQAEAPGLWRFDLDAERRATFRDVVHPAPGVGLPPRDGAVFR